MPNYQHPGVYIEEIPSGAKPIEGVSTSIAVLIGAAKAGPVGEATLVHSWNDYKNTFGDFECPLGLAAFYFFLNGGGAAYIGNLLNIDKKTSLSIKNAEGSKVLEISSKKSYREGNDIKASISYKENVVNKFDLSLSINNKAKAEEISLDNLSMDPSDLNYVISKINNDSEFSKYVSAASIDEKIKYIQGSITSGQMEFDNTKEEIKGEISIKIDSDDIKKIAVFLAKDGEFIKLAEEIQKKVRALNTSLECYKNFTCIFKDKQFILTSGSASASSSVVVSGEETFLKKLKLDNSSTTKKYGTDDVMPATIASVSLHVPITDNDYTDFFGKLRKIRDVNIVLLPGKVAADENKNIIDSAIDYCDKMGCMLLVDPPPNTELKDSTAVNNLTLPTSKCSVLYYPWVKVANPFNAEGNVYVAPSSFAAGIWARIDGIRGIWKAPAGVEASLRGAVGLEYTVEDGEQDVLNPMGVNCLRNLPSYGHVIWGTRTLSTKANPEWRYVPVRRTALYIERSLYNGIQWAVFEPNDHRLWSSLRVNIHSFMDGMFRSGAFQGQKASDAYFVQCGLGDTMTQDDVDSGKVIVVVGFAPLKPAEFVIVRIQQKAGQS